MHIYYLYDTYNEKEAKWKRTKRRGKKKNHSCEGGKAGRGNGWEGKKIGGGRKTGPTELPCRRQWRQRGREWSEERGEREGGKKAAETFNRCVKPLSAFLLGNARSGASRKTIWGLFGLPQRQMCFNKTTALAANKVSLWLQRDEQTSRLLAGIQRGLGTCSDSASCSVRKKEKKRSWTRCSHSPCTGLLLDTSLSRTAVRDRKGKERGERDK